MLTDAEHTSLYSARDFCEPLLRDSLVKIGASRYLPTRSSPLSSSSATLAIGESPSTWPHLSSSSSPTRTSPEAGVRQPHRRDLYKSRTSVRKALARDYTDYDQICVSSPTPRAGTSSRPRQANAHGNFSPMSRGSSWHGRFVLECNQRAHQHRKDSMRSSRNGLYGDIVRQGVETQEELAILRKEHLRDQRRRTEEVEHEFERNMGDNYDDDESNYNESMMQNLKSSDSKQERFDAYEQDQPDPDCLTDLVEEDEGQLSAMYEIAVSKGERQYCFPHGQEDPSPIISRSLTDHQDVEDYLDDGMDEDLLELLSQTAHPAPKLDSADNDMVE